jgi:hypothetical protein
MMNTLSKTTIIGAMPMPTSAFAHANGKSPKAVLSIGDQRLQRWAVN